MSSLNKMNSMYYDLLTKYVEIMDKYHKLEQRISTIEKQKFDPIVKKAEKDPTPKTGSKTKNKK